MKEGNTCIASKATSAFSGIKIMGIEYGIEDYVITQNFSPAGSGRCVKNKIQTNSKGETYFIKQGQREYLSDYMKLS